MEETSRGGNEKESPPGLEGHHQGEHLPAEIVGIPVVQLAVDRAGVLTLAEGQGLRALGLKPQELLGRSAFEVFRPEPHVVEDLRRALKGEELLSRVRAHNMVFEMRYSPMLDDEGGVAGVIVVATDVTERQRSEEALRESEERYRTLFEESRDAIFISLAGKVVNANQAALDLFGFTREEALGSDVGDKYVYSEDRVKFGEAMGQKGFVSDFEVKLKKRDGTQMDCLLTATRFPPKDGQSVGEVQGLVRDITERKRAQERLAVSLREKEGLIGRVEYLYGQARRRADQMRTVSDVAMKVSSILSLEELLPYVARLLRETFGYYSVDIFLLEPEASADFLLMKSRSGGYEEEAPERMGIRMGEGIVGRVAQHGRHILVNDVSKDPRHLFAGHLRDTKSELAVPIMAGDQVLGVLDVESSEVNAFDDTDLATVQVLGNTLGVAIENARLFQQTREVAVLEERNRLAREIHDTLAQGFTGIVLQLEAAEQILEGGSEAASAHLNKARALARESLQEARRSVWDLVPRALEDGNLETALEEEVRQFTATGPAQASFGLSGKPRSISRRVQSALLRICQESLTNVRKHAQASQVSVRLDFAPGKLTLAIKDNGRGFAREGVQLSDTGEGFGLTAMEQRALGLGATLRVESAPGRGTLVEVMVPTE